MSHISALAEALHQLLDARQQRMAEWLIDRCRRDVLDELLELPNDVVHARIGYVVRERLRKRRPNADERAISAMEALRNVLNLWCREGRRATIRTLFRELDNEAMSSLSRQPDLDSEVVSMLRDYCSRAHH